jgi:hypothetical protein
MSIEPILLDLKTCEQCLRCEQPVRRSRIFTDITIFLEVIPTRNGLFYFEGANGLVMEDRDNLVNEPKYRRHRCDYRQDIL